VKADVIERATTWEGLNEPIWRREEKEDRWGVVEAYFVYLFRTMA